MLGWPGTCYSSSKKATRDLALCRVSCKEAEKKLKGGLDLCSFTAGRRPACGLTAGVLGSDREHHPNRCPRSQWSIPNKFPGLPKSSN